MLRLKMAINPKGKIVPFNPMKAFKASSGTAPFILHLEANRRRGGPWGRCGYFREEKNLLPLLPAFESQITLPYHSQCTYYAITETSRDVKCIEHTDRNLCWKEWKHNTDS